MDVPEADFKESAGVSMDVPELDFRKCASVFVRDEFYENIQAPKFHDFSSCEEPSDDIDAFFRKPGRVGKTTRQFEGNCLEPNPIKLQKDLIFPKSADLKVCPSVSTALISGSATAEGASKKARPPVPSNALARSNGSVPARSKPPQRVKIAGRSPVPSTTSERSSNERLQQPSAAEVNHSSENEDPNPSCRTLKNEGATKHDASRNAGSMSCSIFAASQAVFERKERRESLVRDVQCHEISSEDRGTENADSVVKEQSALNSSQQDISQVRDRKRKPYGRSVDGVVSKSLESRGPLRTRVSKVSRKASGSPHSGIGPELKDATTASSRSASQCVSDCSTPAFPKTFSTYRRIRRISDQNRHRKPSSSAHPKCTRENMPTAPKSRSIEAREVTGRSTLVEEVSSMSLASTLQEVTPTIQDVGNGGHRIIQEITKVPVPSSNEETVSSLTTEDRTSTVETTRDANMDMLAVSLNQQQRLISWRDNLQLSREESVAELLSEQLQNLQLKQGDVLLYENKEGQLKNLQAKEENESISQREEAQDPIRQLLDSEMSLLSNKTYELDEREANSACEVDDRDQAAVLEQLGNLKLLGLLQRDESHASHKLRGIQNQVIFRGQGSELTEEACVKGMDTSGDSNEFGIKITKTVMEYSKTALREEPHDVGDSYHLTEPHHRGLYQDMQSKKRKSIDITALHRVDLKELNPTGSHHHEHHLPKVAAHSSPLHVQHPFTARSAPTSAGQHKKMKTTCPQPFRLRTEERGALKEVEFNKKVELYLIEKERAQFVAAPATTKETRVVKPPKVPAKESKWLSKLVQQSEKPLATGCAMQQGDADIRKLRKTMVPHAYKMPSFDRPFKPHRSMKSPTIPSSPNFQQKAGDRLRKVTGRQCHEAGEIKKVSGVR